MREDAVGEAVELGAQVFQRVGLAVDDGFQQADEDEGGVGGF